MACAAELENQADALQQPSRPKVTQMQVQMQVQERPPTKDDDEKEAVKPLGAEDRVYVGCARWRGEPDAVPRTDARTPPPLG